MKAEVVECHNRAELRLAVAPPKAAVGMDNNLAVEFPTVAIGRLLQKGIPALARQFSILHLLREAFQVPGPSLSFKIFFKLL